jgi:O-antigen ligase
VAPFYWIPGISIRIFLYFKDFILLSFMYIGMIYILKRKNFLLPKDIWFFFLILVCLIPSIIFSMNPTHSIYEFLPQVFLPIVFFFIVYNLLVSMKQVRYLIWVGILPSVINSIFLLLNAYDILPHINYPDLFSFSSRGFAGFTFRRTALGAYLALVLPLMVALTIEKIRRRNYLKGGSLIFGVFIVSLTLLSSLCRAGIISASAGVMFVLSFENEKKRYILFRCLFGLFFVLMVGVMFKEQIFSCFRISSNIGEATAGRVYLWQAAWRVGQDNFFTGVGLGKFGDLYAQNFSSVFPDRYVTVKSPHNLYLKYFSEGGILAVLALFVFVFCISKKSLKTLLSIKLYRSDRILICGFIGSLLSGLLLSLFSPGIIFGTFYLNILWWFSLVVLFKFQRFKA